MLHTNPHPHIALTRRQMGEAFDPSEKKDLAEIGEQLIEKSLLCLKGDFIFSSIKGETITNVKFQVFFFSL
jgi:hypothetical protein